MTSQRFPNAVASRSRLADGWVLLLMWSLSIAVVMTWLWIDQTPPAWDQGDHLARAMKHWQVMQQAHWWSGDWWRELWQQAPTQRAPFTYLLTVLTFNLFGTGFDQGVYVNFIFTAILLGSTYAVGRRVFSPTVGLWAAGLSLLSPVLVDLQRDYLLDYPMTAMVMFMFMGLTYFWLAKTQLSRWLTIPLWGVGLSLMLMTRTSGLLFMIPPVGWMLGASLFQRQWLRLGQVILGIGVSLLTIWPWFSTNWLTVISTTLASNSHGIIYRDDPQADTLAGWLFYPEQLPQLLSWPLFCLAAIACLLIAARGLLRPNLPLANSSLANNSLANGSLVSIQPDRASLRGWIWLLVFIVGTYILFSLGSYKALRVFVPCLPVIWIVLSQAIVAIKNRWWQFFRWGAVGVTVILTLHHLFGNQSFVSVNGDRSNPWPNEAVIQEVISTTPFLKTTLGLAANTPQINAYNMSFYGAVADYQVFSRQLSFSSQTALQDSQVLDWYLTKTGDQGAYDTIEAGQQKLRAAIETSPDLAVVKSWVLPDGSELRLHHRQTPPISVTSLAYPAGQRLVLNQVKAPPQVVQGQSYPITYRIEGAGAALESGLLILTWQPLQNAEAALETAPTKKTQWISDHAIGLGYLNTDTAGESANFAVVEQLSIVPPDDLSEGLYRLSAEYLNRKTGEHYTISENAAQIEVASSSPPPNSDPFQDLVTYLNTDLSLKLRDGDIDSLSDQVGRINQYEPLQDYLPQTEQAMTYRLSQNPDNLDWLYTLALAQALQEKAPATIATLETLTKLAPTNPYNWAYLGLVHLYQWQPQSAHVALTEAARLQPDLPYLKLLQTVNAAMELHIPQAVRLLRSGI